MNVARYFCELGEYATKNVHGRAGPMMYEAKVVEGSARRFQLGSEARFRTVGRSKDRVVAGQYYK